MTSLLIFVSVSCAAWAVLNLVDRLRPAPVTEDEFHAQIAGIIEAINRERTERHAETVAEVVARILEGLRER